MTMRNMRNTQEGGTTAVLVGSLKRRLKSLPIVHLSSTSAETPIDTPTATGRFLLKNLNGDLNVHVALGVVPTEGMPLRPSGYPAAGTLAATLQLTPINNFPDGVKMYLRPVFQNPALPQQENHPLAQEIPFGWEFQTEADEVEIEVLITVAPWLATNINGNICIQVTVEYNGQWWDVEAVNYALSQVVLQEGFIGAIATSGG